MNPPESSPSMHIALDIDDTITHAPSFFSWLSHLAAEVSIITYRTDRTSAERTLTELSIRYDRLVTAGDVPGGCPEDQSLEDWKVDQIHTLAPDAYFEDSPEVAHRIQEPTKVFQCLDRVMQDWIGKSLARAR